MAFLDFLTQAIREPATELEIVEDLNLRVCNCSECKKPLIAKADWTRFFNACFATLGRKPEEMFAVAGRIAERPYCYRCLDSK